MKSTSLLRPTISKKVFFALTLVLVLQAGFLFWKSSTELKEDIVKKAYEEINILLISEQQVLEYLVKENDLEEAQKILSTLAVKNNLEQVLLIDDRQKVIAATRLANINQNLGDILSSQHYQQFLNKSHESRDRYQGIIWKTTDSQNIYAIIPVLLGRSSKESIRSDRIGFLYINYNLGALTKSNFNLLLGLFIPELFTLLATALLLAWYFHLSISKRIKNLKNTIAEISQFEEKKHVEVNGNDEISDLSASFNHMIDEIHDYHKRLIKREQDLSITLHSIGDAVIVTDREGRIKRMNPVAEKLTGWKEKQASGLSVREVFPIIDASTRKEIENPVEKVISSGEIVYLSNHTTLIAKDGTEYQIADSAAPIRGADGHIEGMVLVFNDVTEQYRLRETLEQQRKEQNEILQTMVEGIITIDEKGKIITFNRAAEKMFAYDKDEVLGQNVSILIPEPDRTRHDSYLAHYLQTGEKKIIGRGIEVTGLKKDGETFPARLLVSELPDNGSGTRRFIAGFHNLTRIKLQEEQLRIAQKMDALGKLTGGIAHDYNNMLGVILGYSELLEDMLQDNPSLHKYVSEIKHATERGARLTQKLLNFSRRHAADVEVVDLNKLLEDEQDMLQKTLTARIKLVLELQQSDLWPVRLDVSEFEDVIVNLSINAMHAIEGNGELMIKTLNYHVDDKLALALNLEEGDYVQLSFKDSGCGMDDMTREKIFEPFFTTKGDSGTGLGLSQVYGFVERSGGTIQVDSEPGKGTTMKLFFPRYHGSSKAIGDETEYKNETSLKGTETILVVDDEEGLRKLSSEILKKQGYHVLVAESAMQALLILEDNKVDLLFSDVVMPEMDGYELAAIVKQHYPEVKIQLASGFSDDRHSRHEDDTLYNNLLSKPYNVAELLRVIRELLDK